MSTVSEIKDQLVIILGAVTGVNQALDYMPRYFDETVTIGMFYEGSTFDPDGKDSHWAHYKFTIVTYIYMFDEKDTMQGTQETIGELLLAALRATPGLNRACLFHTLDELNNDYIKLGNGNVYATIEIVLTADVEEDV